MNIFFTSDTHFGHKNIVSGVSDWSDKTRCRKFDAIEQHDAFIIDNINAVVKPNDTLYHLGDWSFGGHENILKYRERISCENIHLVLGNHDQHIKPIDSPYRKLFSSVEKIHDMALKLGTEKSGIYGRQKFVLCHFAMRVWENSSKGAIMLHGHSHGSLDYNNDYQNYRTMDVGIDTHNFFPYHLDEIMDIMKGKKINMVVDHHHMLTT